MYSLSIFFGSSPVPAQFLYKDKEKAEEAFRFARDAFADSHGSGAVGDDFGQQFVFKDIYAVMFEDMDLGEESRIQRGLSQARGQANANKRAMSDPVIMAAQRGAGPSVLTPFSNGRFNG